jgi:integrase
VRELRGRDAEQDAKQIGKLSTNALENLVAKHLCAAGVTRTLAHPHTLRAYHLTRLKQLGVRDDAIRERSGHADPRVLYSHNLALVDGDRDTLVEALDVAASSRR